ncbi:MAG: acetoin utilization protein AcuC [Acidobacteria bacterium]|jgi:acetoin utilization protein AcuC|nr:MAG: acetoin utilization protein AcuC [Acidobacteriota bacterium]
MQRKPLLIGSLRYKDYRYSSNHPLRIPRVSLLLELLWALGLLEGKELLESRFASWEELLLFHTEDYIKALEDVDRCKCVNRHVRETFNIGTYENPISPAMWKGSLLATGSSLQAVDMFFEGYLTFNPAGGMHHAYPSKANGFCFINDPGIALKHLLNKGFKRILYIDLDAHHCDGVQDFFYEDDRVFVISLHQSPDYAFPFKRGFFEERGSGKGKGYNLNIPLPKGVNDREYLYVLEGVLPAVKDIYNPEVYVLQLGTDVLREDYLSKFELSNWGFLRSFEFIRDLLGDGIYLGGGGYHPVALARAWTLIWCSLSGRDITQRLNPEAQRVLMNVDFEEFEDELDRSYMYQTLVDQPNYGEIRPEIRELLKKIRAEL